VFGSVKPTRSKSQKRSFARPRPRKRPITEESTPTMSASRMIARNTWRREPPSVRSVANSRVRCAIVIESEFAITKAPTKSAMPPNASRNPWRKVMNSSVSPESSLACSVPVRTCVPSGRTAWTSRTSCASLTPGFAATAISSSLPSLSKSRWAVARSNPASVAPPIVETEPNLTVPDTRSCSTEPSAWTPIVSPIAKSSSSAVASSMATSFARGQSPLVSVSGLKRVFSGSIVNPRFGAPPVTIAFPSRPMICASPKMLPSAASTESTPLTVSRTPSSNGGAAKPCSWLRSNADLPDTTAFEPARESVKMRSNAWSIESVRT
jgi:hypothetical protein